MEGQIQDQEDNGNDDEMDVDDAEHSPETDGSNDTRANSEADSEGADEDIPSDISEEVEEEEESEDFTKSVKPEVCRSPFLTPEPRRPEVLSSASSSPFDSFPILSSHVCRPARLQNVEKSRHTHHVNCALQVVVRNKKSHPIFSGLLRSKGFFWLATRPDLHGEWSQAGTMLTLQGGGPWFCTLDDGKSFLPSSSRPSFLSFLLFL